MLSSYTYEERVEVIGLKPDRADVITHASKIFLTVMKTADIEDIFVPQIGLSDGIIHENEMKPFLIKICDIVEETDIQCI